MKKTRWLQREVVTAVHDNDLAEYLNSIGILIEIQAGSCLCAECRSKVNLENFGGVFPKENNILIVCDRPLCVSRMKKELVDNG
ncbi:MAG: hypothetical protein ABSB32_08155 [Thermodesulfobacteriota bacterium]|jgi:ferredoxin